MDEQKIDAAVAFLSNPQIQSEAMNRKVCVHRHQYISHSFLPLKSDVTKFFFDQKRIDSSLNFRFNVLFQNRSS